MWDGVSRICGNVAQFGTEAMGVPDAEDEAGPLRLCMEHAETGVLKGGFAVLRQFGTVW